MSVVGTVAVGEGSRKELLQDKDVASISDPMPSCLASRHLHPRIRGMNAAVPKAGRIHAASIVQAGGLKGGASLLRNQPLGLLRKDPLVIRP